MIITFDSEYDNRDEEIYPYKLNLNKTKVFNVIKYKNILYGIYISDLNEYKCFSDFYTMLDYLCTLDKEHYLYTFWNYAELSVMDLSKCQIEMLQDIGNSVMLTFTYKGTRFHLKDIKKISGATNLDSFCKTFLNQTPKSHLNGYNHVYEMNIDQIIEYNKDDCIMSYKALIKFYEEVCDIVKKQFDVTMPEMTKFWSLGGIVVYILSHMDKSGFLSLEKENIETDYKISKRKIKANHLPENIRKVLKLMHEKRIYRGGGVIHNLLGLYSTNKNIKCQIYDFISLYPIAGLTAANELSDDISSYKITKLELHELYQLLDEYHAHKKNAFVEVELELRSEFPPICAESVSLQSNENRIYKICHPIKVKAQYYSLFELDELLKYGYVITKINEAIIWDFGKIECLDTWFTTLLKYKNSNDANPELRQIFKLFLNISYGKLVEKRITAITNIIFGSLLSSYSRAIMINIIRNTFMHGDIVYHMATDSIFVTHFDHSYIKELLDKINQYYKTDVLMKKEYEGNIHLLKLKCYKSEDNKKEAHLAITTDNPMQFWKNNLNDAFTMIKHKRCKISMLNNYLKFLKIRLEDIQHLPANLTLNEAEQIIKTKILCDLAGKEIIEKTLYVFKDDFKLRIKESDAYTIHLHQRPFWSTSEEYIMFIEQLNKDYDKIKAWIRNRRRSKPRKEHFNILYNTYNTQIKINRLF